MSRFDWTRAMCGAGPHYYLELLFREEDAPALRASVLRSLEEGFQQSSTNGGCANWTTPDSSEWSYLEVALSATRLLITRGWGYSRGTDADVLFLERLLGHGELSLERWRVQAGGDGYAQIYLESGVGVNKFLAFCAGKSEEASLEEVEEQLKRLMAQPNLKGKYALGTMALSGSKVCFPVLYPAPITVEQWRSQAQEIDSNFTFLAQTLCDLCHVRTSASCGFKHDPVTKTSKGGSVTVNLRFP